MQSAFSPTSVGIDELLSKDLASSKAALEVKIKRVIFRNEVHRNFPAVTDRVREMDRMLSELLELFEGEDTLNSLNATAVCYLRCLEFIDETDTLLAISYENATVVDSIQSLSPKSNSTVHVSALLQGVADRLEICSDISFDKISAGKCKKNVQLCDFSRPIGIDPQPTARGIVGKCLKILCAKVPPEEMVAAGYGGSGYSRQSVDGGGKGESVRDLWNTQSEFFLSCLGFIVGVGNTLRFPSMVFRHGGAFFIPYFFYLFAFGLPLVYMHLCIGQYSGLSASGAFYRIMPIASGIGWALVLLAIPVAIYYNIIVTWSLYYFWYSFVGLFSAYDFPWSQCQPQWITRYNCCELNTNFECYESSHALTSTEAFFHYQVLNRTLLNNPTIGSVQCHLLVALAIAWIIVFFGVFKGLGSIGWAVTFTATIPYLLLFILLLRGLSLNGAASGLLFFFQPDLRSLWSITTWTSAAEQVFYSLGIDAGPLISMASFSRYRNNIYRDAVLLVLLDTFTSILSGMVIFSFVGFLATEQGKEITEILKHDSLYIAFTVYPGVTSFMEYGFLWSALFFAMLTLSSLDAEFAWLEMIASSVMNCVGSKKKHVEKRLLIILCFVFFLCGIPLTAQGGIFIFHAIENLSANWNSFSLSLLQVIVICFIYGVDKFLDDVGEMLRVRGADEAAFVNDLSSTMQAPIAVSDLYPKPLVIWRRLKFFFGPTGSYVKWTWCLFSPLILTCLLVASVWNYDRVTFNKRPLPGYYETIAWITMVGPLLAIPFIVVYSLLNAKYSGKPLSSVFSTANWRRKKKEESKSEPKHALDTDNDYWYIDPLSRGASKKSTHRSNNVRHEFPKISITYAEDDEEDAATRQREEDGYNRRRDMIREIEERFSAERSTSAHSNQTTPSSFHRLDVVGGNIFVNEGYNGEAVSAGGRLRNVNRVYVPDAVNNNLENSGRASAREGAVEDRESVNGVVFGYGTPSSTANFDETRIKNFSGNRATTNENEIADGHMTTSGLGRGPRQLASLRINATPRGAFAMDAIQAVNAVGPMSTQDSGSVNASPSRDGYNMRRNSNSDDNDEDIKETEEETSDYRISGRIGDWEENQKKTDNWKSSADNKAKEEGNRQLESGRLKNESSLTGERPHHLSLNNSNSIGLQSTSSSFLFGPPPQIITDGGAESTDTKGGTETVDVTDREAYQRHPVVRRIKSRNDRRSDQRRNRAFRNFNLIEMVEFDDGSGGALKYCGKPDAKADNTAVKRDNHQNASAELLPEELESPISLADPLPSVESVLHGQQLMSVDKGLAVSSAVGKNGQKSQQKRHNVMTKLKRPQPIFKGTN